MSIVFADMAVSLDGFIAGPNGEDGGLHDWYFDPSESSGKVIEELMQSIGAMVLGKRSYDVGASQGGFEDNPYQMPHFVLAHEVPEMEDRAETDFTFVTDGIESALAQAKAAANDNNVCVAGGANVVNQCLGAGLLDEIRIHLVPVLLGDGIRLFDRVGRERIGLESTRVIESPEGVTHMTFRVVK